jgi:hypothetical protein
LLSQGPVVDGCWSACNRLLRPPAGADFVTRVATTGGGRRKQERGRRVRDGVSAIPCPGGDRTVGPIADRSFDQARAAEVGCPGPETGRRPPPTGDKLPGSRHSIFEKKVANFSLFVGRCESRALLDSLSNWLSGEITAHYSRDFRTDRSEGRSSPPRIGFLDRPKSEQKR